MTDIGATPARSVASGGMAREHWTAGHGAQRRLRKRRFAELRFRLMGIGAIAIALGALFILLGSILRTASSAFTRNQISLDIAIHEADLDPNHTRNAEEILFVGDVIGPTIRTLQQTLGLGPGDFDKDVAGLVTDLSTTPLLRKIAENPKLIGTRQSLMAPVDDQVDLALKGVLAKSRILNVTGNARILGVPNLAADAKLPPSTRLDIAFSDPVLRTWIAAEKELLRARATAIETEIARLRQFSGGASQVNSATNKATKANTTRIDGDIAQLRMDAQNLRAEIAEGAPALHLGVDRASLFLRMNGGVVKLDAVSERQASGTVILPLRGSALAQASQWSIATIATPENARNLSDATWIFADHLRAKGFITNHLNWGFFTRTDSREPELAGIWAGLLGSLLTGLTCLLLAIPFGVAGAIYLEEFAPKNRLTDFIEVNINNLAAVPSIVYGLLGAAVFLDFLGRQIGVPNMRPGLPLVGGMVLALMTLPTIIIATRASLKSIPPSIRVAALGIGASKMQATLHHVLPLATPGILTGAIIGMAHALGETAPLVLIGMQAFISEPPTGIDSATTVLPVLIYSWADHPERAFSPLTAAAILVLLVVLIFMNGFAAYLRRKFETRW